MIKNKINFISDLYNTRSKIKIILKIFFFLERKREREYLDKVVSIVPIVFATPIKTFRKNRPFRKHEFFYHLY